MSVALTRKSPELGAGFGNSIKATFSAQLSGNYAAGGDTLDFTKVPIEGTSQPPLNIRGVGFFAGYGVEFVIGTTLANSKVIFYTSPAVAGVAPLTELAAGAYPAALTAGPFVFEAEFVKY